MLKYNGDGFVAGVPARDLTDEEVEGLGGVERLLASGLYVAQDAPKAARAPRAQKVQEEEATTEVVTTVQEGND